MYIPIPPRPLSARIPRPKRSADSSSLPARLPSTRQPAKLPPQTLRARPIRSAKNLAEVLKAAGTDFFKVVKTTCFLDDIGDFGAFNEIYGQYFTSKPARSCVEVAKLPAGALVEVEVIAEA